MLRYRQRELRAYLTDDTSDVFLCDKCELLKEGNNTGRKHTLVRFQDKQAVMSRRLEAAEEKPDVVVKGHDALNRCIDGLEEFLQKFFAASSAEVRGGPDMLVQLHVVLYDAGDSGTSLSWPLGVICTYLLLF